MRTFKVMPRVNVLVRVRMRVLGTLGLGSGPGFGFAHSNPHPHPAPRDLRVDTRTAVLAGEWWGGNTTGLPFGSYTARLQVWWLGVEEARVRLG